MSETRRKDWNKPLVIFFGLVAPVGGLALTSILPNWWPPILIFVLCPVAIIVSFLCLLVEDESKTGVLYYLEKIFWFTYMLVLMALTSMAVLLSILIGGS